MTKLKSFHTRQEKALIRRYGGRIKGGSGVDGYVNGKPVEVRSIIKNGGRRFRLMKTTHDDLLSSNGSYIFKVNGSASCLKSASSIDRILKKHNRKWYFDRKPAYAHTFLYVDDMPEGWFIGKK